MYLDKYNGKRVQIMGGEYRYKIGHASVVLGRLDIELEKPILPDATTRLINFKGELEIIPDDNFSFLKELVEKRQEDLEKLADETDIEKFKQEYKIRAESMLDILDILRRVTEER